MRRSRMTPSFALLLLLALALATTACEQEQQSEEPPTASDEPALAVEPTCAEIGEGFTVTAAGLEPNEEYVVLIDPPHADELEPGVFGAADDQGVMEVPASLPEDAGVQPGDYTLTVSDADDDEELATAALTIAESCPAP